MLLRRAYLALSLGVVLSAAGLPAGAALQTNHGRIHQVDQGVDSARQERDRAYSVVASSVARRDQVEADLFAALVAYQETADRLSSANSKMKRVADKLALAQTKADSLVGRFEQSIGNAYMNAVAGEPSMVLAGSGPSTYLFASQIFSNLSVDNLAGIDQMAAVTASLRVLSGELSMERDQVAVLATQLEGRATDLEQLFAKASATVATAFANASAADATYRSALSNLEEARAAEQARRREEVVETGGDDSTSSVTIRPTTESWRALVAEHFPAAQVEAALVIIQCESGGDPGAVNPYSGASGLFQFLPGTWAVASVGAGVGGKSVFDAETNIVAAAWLSGYYASRGFDPWYPWGCRVHL